jgi:hypothetical protein
VLVGAIPSDAANPPPRIDAMRVTGDYALVHTLELNTPGSPPIYNEKLAEVNLTASGTGTPIQTRLQGLNVYTYVDDFNSVAYTSDAGIAVAPRSNLSSPTIVLSAQSVFFEFSADSQLVAGITTDRALFLASRGGGSLQLTRVKDPSSQTLSVRVVPTN